VTRRFDTNKALKRANTRRREEMLRAMAVTLGAAAVTLLVANAAFAATSASQSVTFTAGTGVAITAGPNQTISGAIAPGSSGNATGALTVSSNDLLGFQLSAQAAQATITESGTGCTGTRNFNNDTLGVLTVNAAAATGGTGVGGTSSGAQTVNSTSAKNLYTVVPTMTGNNIGINVAYTVTPGYSVPPNTAGCSYAIPVTYTVTGQ
jgi:hypothetical protein